MWSYQPMIGATSGISVVQGLSANRWLHHSYLCSLFPRASLFAGFYTDPAVADSCLHLTAVSCSNQDSQKGVPIACGAFLPPRHSRSETQAGHVNAIDGKMTWSCSSQVGLRIAELKSQSIVMSDTPSQSAVDMSEVIHLTFIIPLIGPCREYKDTNGDTSKQIEAVSHYGFQDQHKLLHDLKFYVHLQQSASVATPWNLLNPTSISICRLLCKTTWVLCTEKFCYHTSTEIAGFVLL